MNTKTWALVGTAAALVAIVLAVVAIVSGHRTTVCVSQKSDPFAVGGKHKADCR